MNTSAEKYHGSFDAEYLLNAHPADRLIDFFSTLGLVCTVDVGGLVYPLCKQASAVLDIMRLELKRLNVDIICNSLITLVKKDKNGFILRTSHGFYTADKVIVATGGKASPSLGGTGAGLDLLKNLGHSIATPLPCLCPVEVNKSFMKSLKGIRARGSVSLFDGERLIKAERGEIQFAENALSGICIFNLTTAIHSLKSPIISLNLMPDYSQKEISDILFSRKNIFSNEPLENYFTGLFNKMIGNALLKDCGILNLSRSCKTLDSGEISLLCKIIQNWNFECKPPRSFAKAQIMAGGVSGNEIDCKTMESKIVQKLYICGEAVDINGDCGGYNLHFAFSSGILAGESV